MTYGDRLNDALQQSGEGRRELASAIGISVQAVGDVINGKTKALTAENNANAARFLSVNPSWLATGKGHRSPMARDSRPPGQAASATENFVTLQRAVVRTSGGKAQVVYAEDDLLPIAPSADFLARLGIAEGDGVAVLATDNSNEPAIRDGAVVLVNRGDRDRLNGEMFAFRSKGELLLRRLERVDAIGVLAIAENPLFKPRIKVYSGPGDIEIIGRAVWTGSML